MAGNHGDGAVLEIAFLQQLLNGGCQVFDAHGLTGRAFLGGGNAYLVVNADGRAEFGGRDGRFGDGFCLLLLIVARRRRQCDHG